MTGRSRWVGASFLEARPRFPSLAVFPASSRPITACMPPLRRSIHGQMKRRAPPSGPRIVSVIWSRVVEAARGNPRWPFVFLASTFLVVVPASLASQWNAAGNDHRLNRGGWGCVRKTCPLRKLRLRASTFDSVLYRPTRGERCRQIAASINTCLSASSIIIIKHIN